MATLVQVPKSMINAPLIKRRTKIILASMVAWTTLSTLIAVAAEHSATSAKTDLRQMQTAPPVTVPPNWSTQAETVAVDYLDAVPTPIPTATGILANLGRPTGSTPIPYQTIAMVNSQQLDSLSASYLPVEDQFLIQTASGSFLLSVVMQYANGGPVLAAQPSVSPAILPGSSGLPLTWKNLPQATLSAGAQSQVTAWAQAYVANNQTALYQLTGDPQAHVYYGLGGWQLVGTPIIVSSTTTPNDSAAASQAGQALIQIQITMSRDGHPNQQIVTSYDLLMADITRPLPPIVAWGPAGTGWTLTTYQNAYPGSPLTTATG
jgi:hypothetical protein